MAGDQRQAGIGIRGAYKTEGNGSLRVAARRSGSSGYQYAEPSGSTQRTQENAGKSGSVGTFVVLWITPLLPDVGHDPNCFPY